MAKRVLGNDPFETRKTKKPEAKKPARKSARASIPPPPPEEAVEVAAELTSIPPPPPDETEAPEVLAEPVVAEATGAALEGEIRDVEAKLDALLAQVAERPQGREVLDRVAEKLRAKIADDSAAGDRALGAGEAQVFDVARELQSSEFYLRQWGRVGQRDRAEDVDEFGMNPEFAAKVQPVFDFLYDRWWRVEAHDVERVPAEGRVILCANHGGAVPYDGAMLASTLRREHPARRNLRWLAEDFIFHMPFLGVFMNRLGAVRACQENAERLLRQNACVGVFPEGVKGSGKLYRDRYKLQRFGRGGHVKLALRTGTTIVPVAILGSEDTHPLLAPTSFLSKVVGTPFVPITPTFPLLGPLGLLPLPAKWKVFFLEPIVMEAFGPDAADDDVLVGRLNEKIRASIQDALDRALANRQSIFQG